MHEHNEILAALAGQPNTGKSTVFNYLTGLHQTVANYPGVTVTKKSGHYHDGKLRIEIVDLPGTYSLTSYSQEERVTRDFLLLERPEAVVLVVDAANLRRHLYLAFQLRELQVPLVVCLNMMDIARRRGFQIDTGKLEQLLGVPVVPTVARESGGLRRPASCSHCRCQNPCQKNETETCSGLELLRQKINETARKHEHEKQADWKIHYGGLEPLIAELDALFAERPQIAQDFPTRWLAIKLLENDREARRIIQHHLHEPGWEELLETCLRKIETFEKENAGDSPQKIIAAKRNEFAEKIENETVFRSSKPRRHSDRLDEVLCNPAGGLISVAVILFLMFFLAFNLSDGWTWFPWFSEDGAFEWNTPLGAVDSLFSVWLPAGLDAALNLPDGDLRSLIYDGIIAGVGGVMTFVPTIFFIFLFVAFLEQSGYMARVVVVLDKIMRLFGFHGQSIVPMVLAGGIVGGCALPAVMATRTMRGQRERLLTILVLPLMNCGAKVPVYGLLISAFFLAYKSVMLAAIILISWSFALLAGVLLGRWFRKEETSFLLIELPAYQMPTLREIFFTAGLQSWWFVKKAGTIILAISVILWALMYYPRPENPDGEALETSYAAVMGKFFEPVSQYAGFDWRDNVALIGGFAAKEVIVSTMATMYGIAESAEPDEENNEVKIFNTSLDDRGKRLAERLRGEGNWTPLKAFVLLLFVMLYNPCAATCAVIWRETGHIRYMLTAMFYTNLLALTVAVTVYQVGKLFGG
ncbi:MAG: ferrous iron transport protein B [Planctomycetaceae bacterium]|nr:ferrous iron transport protein B [Planctomycetaceae bacterium]